MRLFDAGLKGKKRRKSNVGLTALRPSLVDWPVYPRRAEHNTVAEGGNRRSVPPSGPFQSRWSRADRGPLREGIEIPCRFRPRRRASALKRNCDVTRCAVPRHLKLRAMVGRGGIHGGRYRPRNSTGVPCEQPPRTADDRDLDFEQRRGGTAPNRDLVTKRLPRTPDERHQPVQPVDEWENRITNPGRARLRK